jgi:hypothetical protein
MHEVFMLYASPLDKTTLDIRSEAEVLSQVCEGTNVRFKIGVATAGSLTKLLALSRDRSLVVHLSAHTITDPRSPERGVGLILETETGGSHVLWREDLEQLLSSRGGLKNISLLVLNTCNSDELAQTFVECGCRHVIATRDTVTDVAARRFSQQFYYELAVRNPLMTAWEGARQALRIDPEKSISSCADSFVLYGQHGADQKTLDELCGLHTFQKSDSNAGPPARVFEDVDAFLDGGLPTRPENFMGRTQTMHSIVHTFTKGRRACVIHGPKGIGKSALGVEFAHFAAAPGRLFSCSTIILHL